MRKHKFEYCCTDIKSVENYELAKAKLSAARKGMKLKIVDGKRVYYRPEEIK